MAESLAPRLLTEQDHAKWAAARYAAQTYCSDGGRLGLGSGTTSHFFVRALAQLIRDGLGVVGVATSTATRDLATQLGVTVAELDEVGHLDVCFDGADEIDPVGNMIKGGGACLLWEKIVATSSTRWVGLVDASKSVDVLGRFPLPIEITPFSHGTTTAAVRELFVARGYPSDLSIKLRQRDGAPVITDNGNVLIDVRCEQILDAAELSIALNTIPGVVENGLFIQIADDVVMGSADGTAVSRSF